MTTVAAAPLLPAITFHPPRHFDNAAEWLRALGDVPLERVIFDPWPGTATEADLLRFVERDKRLCKLVDGTLVEKPAGYFESLIAQNLGVELGVFVKRNRLGAVSGADSTLRMASTGRVRLPRPRVRVERPLPEDARAGADARARLGRGSPERR